MKNLVGQFSGKKLKHGGVVSTVVFLFAILSLFWTCESHAGQWVQMTSDTDKYLWGVWGSSGSDVYAVGGGYDNGNWKGILLHYDGTQWSEISTGISEGLGGVWGSSASDVFVVGDGGIILHYDGTQWSQMNTGVSANLEDIWGFSGSDVIAVGFDGTALHYDGTQWSQVYSESDIIFNSVWGSSVSDVFVGGTDVTITPSFIAHYNGNTVSLMLIGDNIPSNGIWGNSGSDVFAVGADSFGNGPIYHYNGSSWSEMSQSPASNYLMGVWGSSGSDVFAVGDNGIILHYDGSQWTQMTSEVSQRLDDVWGFSGNDVFAVGDGGTILRYSPTVIIETIPHDGAGIAPDTTRVPNNTSFAMLIEDADGIDLTDTSSIQFTIDDDSDDGTNMIYVRDLTATDVVRVIKLTPDPDTKVTRLWAVYDRSTDAYGYYTYDTNVNIKVDAKDSKGDLMTQASFDFNIETESEHDAAQANLPETNPADTTGTGYDAGIEVTSGDLEGAKILYDSTEPLPPTFGPMDELPPFDVTNTDAIGAPMNLQPPTVFNTPVKIFIPCPGYTDVSSLSIYLYNGTDWVLACDANGNVQPGGQGWMVPGSRVNNDNGTPSTIEIQVYHLSGVQAGVPGTGGGGGAAAGGGGGGGCFIATATY